MLYLSLVSHLLTSNELALGRGKKKLKDGLIGSCLSAKNSSSFGNLTIISKDHSF